MRHCQLRHADCTHVARLHVGAASIPTQSPSQREGRKHYGDKQADSAPSTRCSSCHIHPAICPDPPVILLSGYVTCKHGSALLASVSASGHHMQLRELIPGRAGGAATAATWRVTSSGKRPGSRARLQGLGRPVSADERIISSPSALPDEVVEKRTLRLRKNRSGRGTPLLDAVPSRARSISTARQPAQVGLYPAKQTNHDSHSEYHHSPNPGLEHPDSTWAVTTKVRQASMIVEKFQQDGEGEPQLGGVQAQAPLEAGDGEVLYSYMRALSLPSSLPSSLPANLTLSVSSSLSIPLSGFQKLQSRKVPLPT